MRVWILQTGEPLQIDSENRRAMRAMNLSEALIARDHDVVVWTSNFDHFSKAHRYKGARSIDISEKLRIKLIQSCGYKSNVGIKRLLDHALLGINLRGMLRSEEIPDIAFVGYPPIEPAWIMTRFLRKAGIPIVLDVKDAWPEVLMRGIPRRFRYIGRVFLAPYFWLGKKSLQNSTYLSSISPDFLNWALNFENRKIEKFDTVNLLSNYQITHSESELEEASRFWDSMGVLDDGAFRVSYIGSIASSLNLDQVIESARSTSIHFVMAGNGSAFIKTKEKAKHLTNMIFPGWISTAQASILARRSTLLLAPYANLDDFEMSLPNKFLDAFSHGRPIISSIDGYSRKFIEENNVGRFYSNNIPSSLTNLLVRLQQSPAEVQFMGNAGRKLFESELSGEIVYRNLVQALESIQKITSNQVM